MYESNSAHLALKHGRYLAEVEMKLQLMAEDVEALLASNSTRALSQIPSAVHELSHVKVFFQQPTSSVAQMQM